MNISIYKYIIKESEGKIIMRKASKILLTIGGIFNILIAVGAMIAGLVLVIMALVSGSGAFPELNVAIQEMIEETGSRNSGLCDVLSRGHYCS